MAEIERAQGKPGRKPALGRQHVELLRAITREQPRASLDEVTRELQRRAQMTVCTATVRKALRQAGIAIQILEQLLPVDTRIAVEAR